MNELAILFAFLNASLIFFADPCRPNKWEKELARRKRVRADGLIMLDIYG